MAPGTQQSMLDDSGFKNRDIVFPQDAVLKNTQSVQQAVNLPVSDTLVSTPVCPINLDIEMETGAGKTYPD